MSKFKGLFVAVIFCCFKGFRYARMLVLLYGSDGEVRIRSYWQSRREREREGEREREEDLVK